MRNISRIPLLIGWRKKKVIPWEPPSEHDWEGSSALPTLNLKCQAEPLGRMAVPAAFWIWCNRMESDIACLGRTGGKTHTHTHTLLVYRIVFTMSPLTIQYALLFINVTFAQEFISITTNSQPEWKAPRNSLGRPSVALNWPRWIKPVKNKCTYKTAGDYQWFIRYTVSLEILIGTHTTCFQEMQSDLSQIIEKAFCPGKD